MKTLNNEIEIHRNESFAIDKTIANRDGTPYVISCKLKNPYFLLAVSSTRFNRDDRYMYNKWLELEDIPRFLSTVPYNIKSIYGPTHDFNDISSLTTLSILGQPMPVAEDESTNVTIGNTTYNVFKVGEIYKFVNGTTIVYSELLDPVKVIVDVNNVSHNCEQKVMLGYIPTYFHVSTSTADFFREYLFIANFNGESVYFYPEDGILYKETTDSIDARYWSHESNSWVPYKLRIVTQFQTDVTSDWIEQNYLYSITLVGGELMQDFLVQACQDKGIDPTSLTLDQMYAALVEAEYEFPKYFKYDKERALATIEDAIPILTPTKLIVKSDLHGGL